MKKLLLLLLLITQMNANFNFYEFKDTSIYRRTATDESIPKKSGSGYFTQKILNKETTLVGTIPVNISDIYIELNASKDLDIQLYGVDNTAIIAWHPTGLLSGTGLQTIHYHGMQIEWSGYNGVNTLKGHEYIKITGTTSETLTMKVYGYQAGSASVHYRWGIEDRNTSIFNAFNVGFGSSSAFAFSSSTQGEKIWLSAKRLLLDENLSQNSYYKKIKYFDDTAFAKLQQSIRNSKFIIFWIVPGWKESQFNIANMQALMDKGYIPVFSYWYFGDHLLSGIPSTQSIDNYTKDNIRVANFLKKLHGQKI